MERGIQCAFSRVDDLHDIGYFRDKEARWEAAELGGVIRELIAEGEAPQKVHGT